MSSNDVEKSRLIKLLDGLEVIEIKFPEKCSHLIKEFRAKFGSDEIEVDEDVEFEEYLNPYIPDKAQLEEIDNKIIKILSDRKNIKQPLGSGLSISCPDPKRPWRMHTGKETLLRIDNELKRHHEKSTELIMPIADEELEALVKYIEQSSEVDPARIQETVHLARKSLPNFQYRKIVSPTLFKEELLENENIVLAEMEASEVNENGVDFVAGMESGNKSE